jgi:Pregnancy-associated plasma protein-A/Secretion system C-terminal sorting domain/Fibronectin type III domain
MRSTFISLSLTILPVFLTAQNLQKKCHSNEAVENLFQQNPEIKTQQQVVEEQISRFAASHNLDTRGGDVTIPVVVHIVYRTTNENITDAQVRSQIDALNRDFNKENSDAVKVPALFSNVAASCGIRFQLANLDPQGAETYGIVRHYTSNLTWGVSDDIKMPAKGGFAPWNPAKYMNIWVCNMGGRSIGFASFPGMPAEYDGIVIDYRAFGTTGTAKAPYSMGRTCVHEVGHFLGLYHIWGDGNCGDDHIHDTPTQEADHKGTPSFPQYSNCGSTQTADMFMNYMDYVNDDAMFMFTKGQKDKMLATLTVNRASLIQSTAIIAPLKTTCTVDVLTIKAVQPTTVTIGWDAVAGIKYYTLEYKKLTETTWKVVTTTTSTYTLNNLETETNYECRVRTDCDNANVSKVITFVTKSKLTKNSFDAQTIRAYPNPVTNMAILAIDGETFLGAKVTILDASGQIKFENIYTTATPSVQLDMTEMASGMYLIVVQKDNNRVVKKMMKVRE